MQTFLASLGPDDLHHAVSQALTLGEPGLVADWAADPLLKSAALLRLGRPEQVLSLLADTPQSARIALLCARASWQLQSGPALSQAEQARRLARQEGDAGAIVASAALLGEMQLSHPKLALRTLAEGLKIAELLGEETDAYLLAVLAHAQASAGGYPKALKTAEKALARSPERSPARAVALLALGRTEEMKEVAQAGELSYLWFRPFLIG